MAIILDRTQIKNKNAGNIEKLIQRHDTVIKDRIERELLDKNTIKSPEIKDINVPVSEKELNLDTTHNNMDHVFIGNRKYRRGDKIPKDKAGGSGGGGNESSDGQGPSVVVTKEELEKFLFSECELPNWIQKANPTITDYSPVHAGFTRNGLPGNMDIRRSVSNGIGRNLALTAMYDEEIMNKELSIGGAHTEEERLQLIKELAELKTEKEAILFLDDIDLRYRHKEFIPNFISKGVIFLCLDVSGSMTKNKLEVSKLFFILTIMFLRRFYDKMEIVFIKFADHAKVCTEEQFFDNTFTGGTVLSTPLKLVNELIDTKYNPDEYNIYIVQASDTEDFSGDTNTFYSFIKKLDAIAQMLIFVRIGKITMWNRDIVSTLLNIIDLTKRFSFTSIEDRTEVIRAFIDVFRKRT
jgi:hypothetical protein